MIFLRQVKEFFAEFFTDFFMGIINWVKNFHIHTGEWKWKRETYSGGGYILKKCNWDETWYERKCDICGKIHIKDHKKSDYYNWHE